MNRRLDIFVEDRAHEYFIRALVMRVAREEGKKVEVQIRSATGGHGRAVSEFKKYMVLLEKRVLVRPELIVVGIDSNCSRFNAKRKEILDIGSQAYGPVVVAACPDPHVERWYMVDSGAFHSIVGSTPHIKQKKCKRDYYKAALANAIRQAGHPPTLSGLEFAEELAWAIDMYASGKSDRSFASFIGDLRSAMRSL